MFAYLYVHQIVYGRISSITGVITFITTQMDTQAQLDLYKELKEILHSKALLNITAEA